MDLQDKIHRVKEVTSNWTGQLKKIILLIEESLNINAPAVDKDLPARWYEETDKVVDYDAVTDIRHAKNRMKSDP